MRISIVIPVYNEEKIIPETVKKTAETLTPLNLSAWEILVIDDGSQDGTAARIRPLQESIPQLRIIKLTRNFGKEAAIHAGLSHAQGQAVVVMDADLQHPPELIPQMIHYWETGFKVVEAIKQAEHTEKFQMGSTLFNWAFSKASRLDMQGQCDFKLLDRMVVDSYLNLPERTRFFRALVSWLGYPSVKIPFTVPERAEGSSRWSTRRLIAYAVNNLTSFTSKPLLWCGWVGMLALAIAFVIGLIALVQKLNGESQSGFTTVILLLVSLGGVQLISIGILGHYLAHIYDEIKRRPAYVCHPEERKSKTDSSARPPFSEENQP